MQFNSILPREFKAPELLSGLDAQEPILLGLSGGADSSALLIMLAEYAKQVGSRIYAAHLNHGIRGDEADRDEQFCKELCSRVGVEFFSKKLDIPSIASASGESVETAARNARYDFFYKIMKEMGIKILATAHNADDNLETLLFNIARGTGLGGLCGIPESRPIGDCVVIRPILTMEKEKIISFCENNGLSFVTDSTNADNEYTRNKIRNRIIPILKEINPNAVRNASRMTESLKDDSLCLQSMADWFVEELGGNYSIELEKLCGSPSSIVNRALIRLYDEITGGKALEATHINAIKELARKGVPHSSISLPNGIEARVENGRLCLLTKGNTNFSFDAFNVLLSNGKNEIENAGVEIFLNDLNYSKNIYKKSILLSIESDTIDGALVARSRAPGDKILLGGMHKSVKKLYNEKKIPLELRNRIPIICDKSGIIAIPFIGIRDGARAKQSSTADNTTTVQICIK